MKESAALTMLAALAHATRLGIFRWLVQVGPEGVPAGKIAARLELPATTLSFHLAHLERCGLLRARRDGRMIFYAANYETMDELVAYLTENCCAGADLGACASAAMPRPAGKPTKARRN